jgi:hypothetical protein
MLQPQEDFQQQRSNYPWLKNSWGLPSEKACFSGGSQGFMGLAGMGVRNQNPAMASPREGAHDGGS